MSTAVGLVNTGPTISASGVAISLNVRFRQAYDLEVDYWKPLASMLWDEVPTDQLIQNYFYRETRPYPVRWPRGATRGTKGFRSIRWSTVTKNWTDGVSWMHDDLRNDISRTLESDVRQTASRWATLPMRVRAQMIEGTTDSDLSDSIPNAPDGVGWYSATDGTSAARFGVSGGNIITGTGVANEAMIIKDLFRAKTRWLRMLDTENQPLLDPGILAQGVVVEYPPELEEVMNRALKQVTTLQTIKATGATAGATSNVAAAGVSNVFLDSTTRYTPFVNPWLSDTADWYVHLSGAPFKPFYRQVNEAIQERILTQDTGSETAIKTGVESIFWNSREGFGLNLPYGSVKVNN